MRPILKKGITHVNASTNVLLGTFALHFILCCSVGCGGPKPVSEEVMASAQSAYDEASAAIEAEEYEKAAELLDHALTPGSGLSPDLYSDALVERAIVRARLGRLDEALEDVEIALQGASDASKAHAAKSFILRKQGNKSESDSEMRTARKINRKIKMIRD